MTTGSKTIVKAKYTPAATKDPWGFPIWGYVIEDIVKITPTGETLKKSNGYETYCAKVYSTSDGLYCWEQQNIDFCSRSTYVVDGKGIYTEPSPSIRYVEDGLPVTWDPDLQRFLFCRPSY